VPVTKTAKRALRSSSKKAAVNKSIAADLEVAIRIARKNKKRKDINRAMSLADKAAKKHVIHRNKAARIKSQLSKLRAPKKSVKKASKKK